MEADIRTFSAVAVLLVTAVLCVMFRTPRGVLLPLLAVALGVVWTDGLMSLVGQPITIGSLVLNPLLMAIGVAYAIHVMSRYFQEIDGGGGSVDVLERTLDHVGLPVALAAVTTVFGFATLIPHPVPTIRDLGLYASFGIVVIYVASMTVVPAILVLMPLPVRPRAGTAPKRLVDALEAIGRITSRHPRAVMLLTDFGLLERDGEEDPAPVEVSERGHEAHEPSPPPYVFSMPRMTRIPVAKRSSVAT